MKKHISIFTFSLCAFAALSAFAHVGYWYFETDYKGRSNQAAEPKYLASSADGLTFTATNPPGMEVANWGWAESGAYAQQFAKVNPWYNVKGQSHTWTADEMGNGVAVVRFDYIPLTVSFNGNGGNGSMAAINDQKYNSDITLPANAFTKTGYHFTGWKTNATKGVVFEDKAKLKGSAFWNGKSYDSTLYAQWSPNTYTVHFDGNGETGGSMADETFTYDETKALTANAFEKDGFAFSGWATNAVAGEVVYKDKESVRNLTTENKATINLYARWTEKFAVTFREDEQFKETTPKKDGVLKIEYVVSGGSATPPDDPAHTGYRFTGWSGNYTGVKRNENVYAKYEANSYRVIFHANDGSGVTSEQPFHYGESKALLPLTRKGYGLRGWAESADSTVLKYKPEEVVANLATEGEVHLYALWTPISYSVKFDANGGEGTMDDVLLEYDKAYVVPECAFTKNGCEFKSWQVLIGGKVVTNYLAGTTVSNLTSEAGGTVTFRADWLGRYTIAFDANGGEGTMESTNVERDVGFQLPSNAFTRTGYDFTMWTTNLSASVKPTDLIADGATVTNLVVAGETCTLHALWDPHHYTVTFDANGGKGEGPGDKNCTYDEEVTLPTPSYVPPKNYATFIGWSTNKNDVGGVYTVSNLTAKANGIVTVYAVWKYDVGEWSRVLDCDNLKFENEESLAPWVAVTNDYGGKSPSYAFHNTNWKSAFGVLSAIVDESGTLSFWWKAASEEDSLTVQCIALDDKKTVLFETSLPWRSDDWVLDNLRIDLPSGMDAVQVRFIHGNPADIFLDCVTWTPDGGGEPTPGESVNPTAAGVEGNVFSLTIPTENGADYGVWTNADLTVDSWGLMGDPRKGDGNPWKVEWTILPGFPQLFFRAHKVEYK